MKKRIFGEVTASLESGERTKREAANSACLREFRRNNQARGVVCTPRAWMCLNGGGAGDSGWDALYLNFDLKNTAFAQLRLIETAPLLSFIRARMPKNGKNLLTSTA